MCVSIVIDAIKLQTGYLRPNFLFICEELTNFCFQKLNSFPDPENLCKNNSDSVRTGRMSFPSLTTGLSTYVTIFLAFHLTFALPHRALRILRIFGITCLLTLSLLLSLSRVTTDNNSMMDVLFAIPIGLLFALYTVFLHVNAFANRMSNTNFCSSKRTNSNETLGNNTNDLDRISISSLNQNENQDWFWKRFHIPRAQAFGKNTRNMFSRGDKQLSHVSSFNSNRNLHNHDSKTYINPAFESRNDILDNHLHRDLNTSTTGVKHTMRTFPNP